jgi:hypothetical protein
MGLSDIAMKSRAFMARFFRRYWFDWQYVLKTGRLPAFKPVAIVITAAPLIGNINQVVSISTTGFWIMWSASVASLAAFGLSSYFCPRFIREYETYEQYNSVGHSHRWLVWLFHENLRLFPDPAKVLRETVDKRLSFPAGPLHQEGIIDATPVMPTSPIDESALKPVNANRDLYMGFWLDGQRYVLAIQEADPEHDAKARELFWIISAALLKSRPVPRFIVWSLYVLTAGLLLYTLGNSLISPWISTESTVSFGDRLITALSILFGAQP